MMRYMETFRISRTAVRLSLACVLVFSLAGCCKAEKNKVADLESKLAAMQSEAASSKMRIAALEPLEKKLETCELSLAETSALLGRRNKEDVLTAQRQETLKRLLDKLKGVIESGELAVRIRRGQMVIELPSAVLFESGKADLSEKGLETISSVAEVLKEIKDRRFQVAGHTDNVRVSEDNPFESNWHLSTARSIAVVQQLSKKGVNPRSLSAAGYAQFQPLSNNKSPKGKARNRRIEIALMPNLNELPDLSKMEQKLGLVDPAEPVGPAY